VLTAALQHFRCSSNPALVFEATHSSALDDSNGSELHHKLGNASIVTRLHHLHTRPRQELSLPKPLRLEAHAFNGV